MSSYYEDDESTMGAPVPIVPVANRQLRACLKCHILLTQQQFQTNGCPNCPSLGLAQNKKAIEEYTTTQHDGMMIVLDEMRSWIAKWTGKKAKGAYAMRVYGDLPEMLAEEEYDDYA